jgi:hypothetical protein
LEPTPLRKDVQADIEIRYTRLLYWHLEFEPSVVGDVSTVNWRRRLVDEIRRDILCQAAKLFMCAIWHLERGKAKLIDDYYQGQIG